MTTVFDGLSTHEKKKLSRRDHFFLLRWAMGNPPIAVQ